MPLELRGRLFSMKAVLSRMQRVSQWHRQCEMHCFERNDGQARWPNASSIDIPATRYLDTLTIDWNSHRGFDESGQVVQDYYCIGLF